MTYDRACALNGTTTNPHMEDEWIYFKDLNTGKIRYGRVIDMSSRCRSVEMEVEGQKERINYDFDQIVEVAPMWGYFSRLRRKLRSRRYRIRERNGVYKVQIWRPWFPIWMAHLDQYALIWTTHSLTKAFAKVDELIEKRRRKEQQNDRGDILWTTVDTIEE